MSELP